jgi:hypothetical protein
MHQENIISTFTMEAFNINSIMFSLEEKKNVMEFRPCHRSHQMVLRLPLPRARIRPCRTPIRNSQIFSRSRAKVWVKEIVCPVEERLVVLATPTVELLLSPPGGAPRSQSFQPGSSTIYRLKDINANIKKTDKNSGIRGGLTFFWSMSAQQT